MKEAYYFQHDYEPISDPKITALLAEYGAEGYGIFWRIIEMLHSNTEHKLPKKKYIFIAIAKQLVTKDNNGITNYNKIEDVINYATDVCELFLDDKEFIISKRVLDNFKKREDISEKRSEAGKRSASIRWGNEDNKRITKENFVKQKVTKSNKGKEIKTKERDTISPFGEDLPNKPPGKGMVF